MPTHQYAQLADTYLQARIPTPGSLAGRPKAQIPDIVSLAMTTRAYTRVVMRLRAQAESEARAFARSHLSPEPSRDGHGQVVRSSSSRTPSPTSLYSHGKSSVSSTKGAFRSPLVRLHRAPLLRVFVPSPEGEWLSDSSGVECEAELKRAGVLKLLRVGDVVWDVAVGDEGNLGRMVWDGSYLVVSPLFIVHGVSRGAHGVRVCFRTLITSTREWANCLLISTVSRSLRRISTASFGRV
jgi:hypothetical protein